MSDWQLVLIGLSAACAVGAIINTSHKADKAEAELRQIRVLLQQLVEAKRNPTDWR